MKVRKLNRDKLHKRQETVKSLPPENNTARPSEIRDVPPDNETTFPRKKIRRKLPLKKKILYLVLVLVVAGEALLYHYSTIKKAQSLPPTPPEIKTAEITAHFYGLCMDIIQQRNLNDSLPATIDGMTEAPGFTYTVKPENAGFHLSYDKEDVYISYDSAVDFEAVFHHGETE